jgi:hypothetical protein
MTRKTEPRSVPPAEPALSRRTLFAGAGTAGALAAAMALLHGTQAEPTVTAADGTAGTAGTAERGEGYRLTEHIKRYYQTARV